jgi:hypothetical protein
LLQQDVRLVDREKAEIIVEVRFAGLGVDRTGTFVGVPAAAVAPFVNESVGADAVDRIPPEIEIYQSRRQQGYGSVSYIAYWADSGLLVTGGGPGLGRSELNRRKLLFLNLNRSTIPTVQE